MLDTEKRTLFIKYKIENTNKKLSIQQWKGKTNTNLSCVISCITMSKKNRDDFKLNVKSIRKFKKKNNKNKKHTKINVNVRRKKYKKVSLI